MTLLFSPFESYFDAQGRPNALGQQLLAQINTLFASVNAEIDGFQGIPDGGTTGQVLTKLSATDYAADWQTIAIGSGTFMFDDGTASAGGTFELEDGGA